MKPDDELCLCFHVSFRKVVNFARVERIRQATQLAECFGAGTGCGWCRKTLQKVGQRIVDQGPPDSDAIEDWLKEFNLNKQSYAAGRDEHRAK
jgi:bacterioferritin-associated ferredoxin